MEDESKKPFLDQDALYIVRNHSGEADRYHYSHLVDQTVSVYQETGVENVVYPPYWGTWVTYVHLQGEPREDYWVVMVKDLVPLHPNNQHFLHLLHQN